MQIDQYSGYGPPEDEAREAARRMVEEYAGKLKARAEEAEARLSSAFQENEELVHLLVVRKEEFDAVEQALLKQVAALKEELQAERDTSSELRKMLSAAKAETLRVAQTCAEKMADAAERMQEKDATIARLTSHLHGSGGHPASSSVL
eukprot:Sspe_Gene.63665::Locus_36747_Transcript_2_2_Confidence_0.667_Length_6369::g.63665::m.63665